jgi:hypothetical protein
VWCQAAKDADTERTCLQQALSQTLANEKRLSLKLREEQASAQQRLQKQHLRNGRDKLLFVWKLRLRWSTRGAFETWQLLHAVKQSADSLRQAKLKLQVGQQHLRAEQLMQANGRYVDILHHSYCTAHIAPLILHH